MPGLRLIATILLLTLGSTPPAAAYVRTMSVSGQPLFWSNPSVSMRGNPQNISGLSEAQVASMLSPAFTAWQVPGTRANFSYSQSSSNPANSSNDGINAVYFASASGRTMESYVVALTEVLYQVSNGQILEADMSFNDNFYRFTANEGDTGLTIGGRTAIYLRDVATHEAGHVLGLDHSIVNQSSLIFIAFSGQYSLANDDITAVRTVYPSGTVAAGSMSGTVSGTQGGIFGAHVTAINLATGKVEAGALAGTDGRFRLGDIPAGKYAVMMEPYGSDISSISSYYKNVNHRFCGSSKFRRRFYSACNAEGAVSILNVGANNSIDLGTLAPSCSSMGNPGGPPNSISAAREVSNDGGAAWGTMRPGETHYYVVHNVSGQLNARVLSYSLYSPVDVKVQILDAAGAALAGATSVDNVQNPGAGGVTNYDSIASANVASGDYLIQITSAGARIPASKYSAGSYLLDGDGHYLLALEVNGNFGAPAITDMSACTSVRNSSQSASFKEYTSEKDSKDRNAAGCASLVNGGGPFTGGMMQVLLTALAVQLMVWLQRFRLRLALVRKRR